MKLSVRKAILLHTLLPISLIFIVFAVVNIYQTSQEVHRRIEGHMTDLAYSYASLFNEMLTPIAGIAKMTTNFLETDQRLEEPEIYQLLRQHVENNPIIYGAWVAFAPYQFDKTRKFVAPYVYRHAKRGIIQKDFAVYDYTEDQYEFWRKPVAEGKGIWTEPYFAEVGDVMMSSFAVPFYRNGQLMGVAGVDIPLQEINANIHIPGVKDRNIMILSHTGKIIFFPVEKYIGENVSRLIDQGFELVTDKLKGAEKNSKLVEEHKAIYNQLIKSMLAGKVGNADFTKLSEQADFWYFYAPIKSPGWSFAIRVDEYDIFSSVYTRIMYSLFFFGILLLLISVAVFLVSNRLSNAFAWIIERCLRIERMNFHEAQQVNSVIEEVWQLSRTLDRMCAALNSYFSVKEDARIAKAIRQQTLPSKMRQPPGFQFSVWSVDNEEHCGETYDSVDFWRSSYSHAKELLGKKPEGTAYLLLDTPDKGVDAAIKNTHLRAIFSSYAKLGVDPLDTVKYMNDYLHADLSLPGPVQAWLGVIDNSNSTLSTISLGLNTVLLFSAQTQTVRVLQNYPFALSIQKELPDVSLQDFVMQSGDILCVATDGVSGAMNEERQQFGAQRLIDIINKHYAADAQDILDQIANTLSQFTENSSSRMDATIMLIKRLNHDVSVGIA